MVKLLQKIATPVLANMANGNLKKNFTLELSPTWDGRNQNVAYMEAFARLKSGALDGTQKKAFSSQHFPKDYAMDY